MKDFINNNSKFTKKFMLAMLAFLALIAVQTFTIELFSLAQWQVIGVTLLPIMPLIWAFFIYRKHFKSLDEYMQRLTGEAFLWVIAIVSFVTFAYGMLAMKVAMPEFNIAYLLPAIFGGHGVVLQLLLSGDNSEE
ncbi:MAG: hypothetical protein ACPG46_06030 [Thalassotalea sp.]